MFFVSKKIVHCILVSLFFCLSALQSFKKDLLYTALNIIDPRILTIINTNAFQRLQQIHQYGISSLVMPNRLHTKKYTRYDHSLGVYWLTHRYGAPFNEQIAALLHDASHTAFSHAGDQIFEHKDGKDSYQDVHHGAFLSETDIPEALQACNLTLPDVDHKQPAFTCLEQPLPDMCADRLEYNLAGGILEGLITPQEAHAILDHLKFENGRWYFTDQHYAQKFAHISLWHTEHIWGAQMDNYIVDELAQAIRKAFDLHILSRDEVIHGTDEAIWQKLLSCNSEEINHHINHIVTAHEREAEILKRRRNNKFRGIDPWVLTNGEFKRLTDLNEDFKKEYHRVKAESY